MVKICDSNGQILEVSEEEALRLCTEQILQVSNFSYEDLDSGVARWLAEWWAEGDLRRALQFGELLQI